jgi:hypothetical protein
MIQVVLTKEEVTEAARIGCKRQIESMFRGSPDFAEYPYQIHVFGSLGECAVAKGLGVEWTKGVNTFGKPDLPHNIQVKTRSDAKLDLKVPFKAKDEHIYVLVNGKDYTFNIVGFISAKEAKEKAALPENSKWAFWPHKAWYIPQSELYPIEKLELPE